MFKNLFNTAWRYLRRNKGNSTIKITGLAVGIAASLLIFAIIRYELSFNQHFSNFERLVRVVDVSKRSTEGESYQVCVPLPAMDAMEESVTQFEKMSRVKEHWPTVVIHSLDGQTIDRKFTTGDGEMALFVEPEFFDVFNWLWIEGERAGLDEPNVVILTKSFAEKCFDDAANCLGRTMVMDNEVTVKVGGVVADPVDNSDFPIFMFISYPTFKAHGDIYFYDNRWGSCSSNNQVYALLASKDQVESANAVLAEIGKEEYNTNPNFSKYHTLQLLADMHYDEKYPPMGGYGISKKRLFILGCIGVLILLMACFNFINLTTAEASSRAKEVGVRKTLGVSKPQLIWQFLSETGMVVLFSILIGLGFALLATPLLSVISHVPNDVFERPEVLGTMIFYLAGIFIFLTLVSGLYPAFILSSFAPISAIKNNVHKKVLGAFTLRQVLVVAQFVIAMVLIIGTMITLRQMDYIRNIDLGFSQDLVYTFQLQGDSATISNQSALKNRIEQIAGVEHISYSSDQPSSGNTWSSNWRYGSHPDDEQFHISMKFCDEDYYDTYGLQLLAGRWLNQSDTMREAVLNMYTLEKLGIKNPGDAIGEKLHMGRRALNIVGVTKDFHSKSLHHGLEPILMTTTREYYFEAGAKIRSDEVVKTTNAIKAAFDEVYPEQVFNGRYLDERLGQFYEDENRFSATCRSFALLAIFIACLGLLGLAALAAAQRRKEVGIRKVLGASLSSVVGLLSQDFMKLIVISIIISIPLSYYLMGKWLENFTYRIDQEWWIFAIAAVGATLIAALTISYQSIKSALMNPVQAIKEE